MRLLKEPLVHFALAGGLLFGVYSWLDSGDPSAASAERTVRITEREVSWIVETSTRQWQRRPTTDELRGLVSEYLREELLAREARELELDRDDTVVRRRLAQKMTFFLEDTARLTEPTEAELRALYDAAPEKYRTPARSTFEQIYFSSEKRGERAAEDARKVLEVVSKRAAGDSAGLGDPTLLPPLVVDAEPLAISGQFGESFTEAVGKLSPGAWQGPIRSEFGVHLVRITERVEPRPQAFEEVRSALLDEWRRDREAKAKEAYFSDLLKKYDVQVSESVRPLLGPALGSTPGAALKETSE